jgi:NAD(P)-dependent dehydrogenase (short-subunit alcohol dehydrogenase family)
MDIPSLAGKGTIVTGAAMGMGESTAKLFARAGAKVLVADMNVEQGERVVDEIKKAGGVAVFKKVDVSKSSDVEAMVATAVKEFGKLDAAVNNAAVIPDNHPIAEMVEAEFDRVIAVDLKGVALCLKFEIAQMLRQGGGGSIINIGSVSSFRPQPHNSAYCAAKHGVIGLTRVAALENAPSLIRVNAVAPGSIETPMLRGAIERNNLNEADIIPVLSLFNRWGYPEEVAHASLWLASDLSSYVTGITLPVDAGYLNR